MLHFTFCTALRRSLTEVPLFLSLGSRSLAEAKSELMYGVGVRETAHST